MVSTNVWTKIVIYFYLDIQVQRKANPKVIRISKSFLGNPAPLLGDQTNLQGNEIETEGHSQTPFHYYINWTQNQRNQI